MSDSSRERAVTRRSMLGTLGLAAGTTAFVHDALGSAEKPGAQVEDRATSIRINGIKPTICADRVYLKVMTNHGVSGWGEIKGVFPKVAKSLCEEMFSLLDGQNPTRIEHIWQILYRAHRNHRGGPFMVHCIAGIDAALWDITGKLYGVPVYRLLGGPTRDKLRVYPAEKAVKLGASQRRHVGDPIDIDRLVEQVRSTRERVGRDGTVMFDTHSAIPHVMVQQFAASIEAYDLLFIEEPSVPGNVHVFKKLRDEIRVPLATGERVRTIWEVMPYLTEQAVDILQPDAGYTGGISQLMKIATLAEAYFVPLAPHCTQSFLGSTTSFHAAFSVPFFLIHEVYEFKEFTPIVRKTWEIKDGYATLPQGTGLCVEIDEAALERVAATTKTRFKWRRERLPDGSVADY